MMTSFARCYLWGSIQSNARVLSYLLRDVPTDSPRWDARPDAERFTLREVVAHLLDYDSVTRDRFERMIREDGPTLEDWDPAVAAEHYAARDPKHQLENLLVSRQELGTWLEGLSDKEWMRTGTRPRAGAFSVEEGAAMLIGHDGYHFAQVIEWLEATK